MGVVHHWKEYLIYRKWTIGGKTIATSIAGGGGCEVFDVGGGGCPWTVAPGYYADDCGDGKAGEADYSLFASWHDECCLV